MTTQTLLRMTAPLGDRFEIPYHDIGPKEKAPAVALVAGLHGNELNGVFVLSRLADLLKRAATGKHRVFRLKERVVVVPAVNLLGVNTRSRNWPFDKTDINRMFPGHDLGETTQRIAYSTIAATKDAQWRIDIHSSNLDFEEIPQVRLYDPQPREREGARRFGLSTIVELPVSTVFTSTLGHAWRWFGGENYVIQVGQAGNLQLGHCSRLFQALLRFLVACDVLEGRPPGETEDVHSFGLGQTFPIISELAGMFVSSLSVGRWLRAGETLGYLYDPYEGTLKTEIKTPVPGLLSGLRRQPMLCEGDLLARIQTLERHGHAVDTYLHSHGQ